MNRLLAGLAIAFAATTVTPASANVGVCDIVNCAVTCLPGCLPDPHVCYYVDPFGLVCL